MKGEAKLSETVPFNSLDIQSPGIGYVADIDTSDGEHDILNAEVPDGLSLGSDLVASRAHPLVNVRVMVDYGEECICLIPHGKPFKEALPGWVNSALDSGRILAVDGVVTSVDMKVDVSLQNPLLWILKAQPLKGGGMADMSRSSGFVLHRSCSRSFVLLSQEFDHAQCESHDSCVSWISVIGWNHSMPWPPLYGGGGKGKGRGKSDSELAKRALRQTLLEKGVPNGEIEARIAEVCDCLSTVVIERWHRLSSVDEGDAWQWLKQEANKKGTRMILQSELKEVQLKKKSEGGKQKAGPKLVATDWSVPVADRLDSEHSCLVLKESQLDAAKANARMQIPHAAAGGFLDGD